MLLTDLLLRYQKGFPLERLWITGAFAVAACFALSLLIRRPRRAPAPLRWTLFLGVAGFGLAWAWELLWLADDAFFAFRYAEHFARGNGIVFNVGERVEGYTDFLWVVLLGACIRLGADVHWASVVGSLGSLVGVLILSTRLANRLAPPRAKVLVSIGALLTAANYIVANYGTSGLETMMGAFWVMLALDRAHAGKTLAAGTAGIAAAMTHPDHAIFYAALAAALALQPGRVRKLAWYALPFFLVFVPYYLWRWNYYGDFFPNTYYAKSGSEAYWSQGTRYILVTFFAGGLFVALPVAVLGALARWRNVVAQYFLIATPIFTVYVAKVGGDFMLGRLFVPVLPVLFLMAECGVRDLFGRFRWWARPFGLAALAGVSLAAIPVTIIYPFEKAWHIADERTFYPTHKQPLQSGSMYADWGRILYEQITQRGLEPWLGFSSAGMVAYYSKLPMIDTFGLTDRYTAHRPIRERGRPGHEKDSTGTYLIARKVDISEGPVYPPPYADKTWIQIDSLRFYLANFKADLLDELRRNPKIQFWDIRGDIDNYDVPRAIERGQLECDLAFLQTYYFSNNTDEGRRNRLRERIAAAEPALQGLEAFMLDTAPAGWAPVQAFHFDPGEGWVAEGPALASWPAEREVAGQSFIIGNVGSFAMSATEQSVDDVTGRLVSPRFQITGSVITLRVGGGRAPDTQRVSLLVDGQRVYDETGCGAEILDQRIWNVSSLIGKSAQVEIVDASGGGWQHILVDEIVQWKKL